MATLHCMLLFLVIHSAAAATNCTTHLEGTNLLKTTYVSASSEKSTSTAANVYTTGWCASTDKHDDWVQFTFPSPIGVQAVIVAPLDNQATSYPTMVHVQYMPNGQTTLQEVPVQGGMDIVATKPTISTSNFGVGLAVKAFRLILKGYQGHACMKVQLIGCPLSALCPSGCQHGGICSQENRCDCMPGYTGATCEQKACQPAALGLGDGRIPIKNVQVSSEDSYHTKSQIRLSDATTGWCAASTDKSPWVQVKLDKPMAVSKFVFHYIQRKEPEEKMYTRTFDLQYVPALDKTGLLREYAKDIPCLNGTHYFDVTIIPEVVTDTVRIVSHTIEKRACFKLEIHGCDPTTLCSSGWCMNGGQCMGKNACSCPTGFVGARCDQKAADITATNLGFIKVVQQTLVTTTYNFTVSGHISLQTVNHTSVVTITGTNNYITLPVTPTSCLTNIDHCTSGFTLGIDINFAMLLDNTYILSSGGNLPGHQGIVLLYTHNSLTYIVSSSTQQWTLVVPYPAAINTWQHFELTWNKNLGIELLVNGHVLGSAGRPANRPATQHVDFCIACSHHTGVSINVSMQIKDIVTWSLDRTELVNAGLKPTPVSTNTPVPTAIAPVSTNTPVPTAIATTTPVPGPTYQQYNLTFLSIVNNLLVTPTFNFTLYNKPQIDLINNSHTILTLDCSKKQYIELPDKGIPCIEQLGTCTNGFTFKLQVLFTSIDTTAKTYIISSGSDVSATSGLGLYIQSNQLTVGVKKAPSSHWAGKCDVSNTIKTGVWYTFEVSWSNTTGVSVVIDGYEVINENISTPSPIGQASHPVLIGKGPNENSTSCMKVRDFFTWTIHREVLVDQGILKALSTRPTPASTMQTATTAYSPGSTLTPRGDASTTPTYITIPQLVGIQPYQFNFVSIDGNILITTHASFQIYGKPSLLEFLGNVLQLHGGTKDYIQIKTTNVPCLDQLYECKNGFTYQFTVVFSAAQYPNKTYLISTGGERNGNSGAFLYYEHNKFYFGYSFAYMQWKANVEFEIKSGTKHEFIFSWYPSSGITLIIDGKLEMNQKTAVYFPLLSNHTLPLTIGKNNTASIIIIKLQLWPFSFETLVQNNILPAPITTTSTTSASTIKTTTSTLKPTLPSHVISQIVSYNVSFISITGNIITTPSYQITAHGNVKLVHLPTGENAVKVNSSNGEYIEIAKQNITCITTTENCNGGFTISIRINFVSINSLSKVFIINSGNIGGSSTEAGFYLYYQNHTLHYGATYGYSIWTAHAAYAIDTHSWYTIEFTLSHGIGPEIYINGTRINPQHTTNKTISTSVDTFGTITAGNVVSTLGHTNHTSTSLLITGLHFWPVPKEILLQSHKLSSITSTQATTIPNTMKPVTDSGTNVMVTESTTNGLSVSTPGISVSSFTQKMDTTAFKSSQVSTDSPKVTSDSSTKTVTENNSSTKQSFTRHTTQYPSTTDLVGVTIPSYEFNFTSIEGNMLHSGKYILTAHGNPTLVTLPSSSIAVKLNSSHGEYVEFGHQNITCLSNVNLCSHGFTIQIAVNILLVDTSSRTYIVSSGRENVTSTGMFLYYYNHSLYFGYTNEKLQWSTHLQYELSINNWHTFQLSWSHNTGIALFINGTQIKATNTSVKINSPPSHGTLIIGRNSEITYTTLLITGLQYWPISREILIQSNVLTNAPTSVETVKGTTHAISHTANPFSVDKTTIKQTFISTLGTTSSITSMSNSITYPGPTAALNTSKISSLSPENTTHNSVTSMQSSTLAPDSVDSGGSASGKTTVKQHHVPSNTFHSPDITTMSSLETTLKKSVIHYLNFGFNSIVGNLITAGQYQLTAHGNLTLVQLPTGEHAIQLNSSKGEFIQTHNQNITCIDSLSKCEHGLTVQIGINFITRDNSSTTYIISSGSHNTSNTGLYLYYLHNSFHFGFTFGTLKWTASYKYEMTTNVWHTYQISWSHIHGIALYVDGTLLTSSNTSVHTLPSPGVGTLTIGSSTKVTHTTLVVTGLQIWSASREILLQANALTSASTKPSSAVPNSSSLPTTKSNSPTTAGTMTTTDTLISSTNGSKMTSSTFSSSAANANTPTTAGPTKTTETLITSTDKPKTASVTSSTSAGSANTPTTAGSTQSTDTLISSTNRPNISSATPSSSAPSALTSTRPTHLVSGITNSASIQSSSTISTKATATSETSTVKYSTPDFHSYTLSFTNISGQVIIAGKYTLEAHGNLTLVQLQTGEHAIKLNSSKGEFIQIHNQNITCIDSVSKCEHGLTVQIGINFITHDNTSTTYIISSGPHNTSNSGLYLYYLHNTFHFGFTFGTLKWTASYKYEIKTNVWHTYQITWSHTHGIALYVDGTLLTSSNTSVHTLPSSIVSTLSIGRSTEVTHTTLMITELQIWSASREILLQANALTSASTKPSSAVPNSVSLPTTTSNSPTTAGPMKPTDTLVSSSTGSKITSATFSSSAANANTTTTAGPAKTTETLISSTNVPNIISTTSPSSAVSALTSARPTHLVSGDTNSVSIQSTSTISTKATATSETSTVKYSTTDFHSYTFSFTNISGQVIIAGKYTLEAHGNLTLVQLPTGEHAITLNSSKGEFIQVHNQNITCIDSVSKCEHGLTVQIGINFITHDNSSATYIISSGPHNTSNTGLYLYYLHNSFHFGFTFGTLKWTASYKYEITTNVWHTYQISWSHTHGISLYVDGTMLTSSNTSVHTLPTPIVGTLSIGSSTNVTHTTLMITGLQIWSASREILLQANVLTTVSTKPSIAVPNSSVLPTTKSNSPTTAGTMKTTDTLISSTNGSKITSSTFSSSAANANTPTTAGPAKTTETLISSTNGPNITSATSTSSAASALSSARPTQLISGDTNSVSIQSTSMITTKATAISETSTVKYSTPEFHSYTFSFTNISGQVIIAGKYTLKAHGNLTLVQLPTGEHAIKLNSSKGEFIQIHNQNITCIDSLSKCEHGLTVQIGINFITHDNSSTTYIISSGSHNTSNSGLYLYYLHNTFHFGFTFGTLKWAAIYKYEITTNVWHTYQISWSHTHGLALYVDGTLLTSSNTSVNTLPSSGVDILTIGSSTKVTHTTIMITGLQIWSASREILLQSNAFTTASTKPSSAVPNSSSLPTTKSNILTTAGTMKTTETLISSTNGSKITSATFSSPAANSNTPTTAGPTKSTEMLISSTDKLKTASVTASTSAGSANTRITAGSTKTTEMLTSSTNKPNITSAPSSSSAVNSLTSPRPTHLVSGITNSASIQSSSMISTKATATSETSTIKYSTPDFHSYTFSFTNISGHVIIAGKYTLEAHGNLTLVQLPTGEHAIKLNSSKGEFIQIHNQNITCIDSLSKCEHGLTVQIGIKFITLDNSSTTHIISSESHNTNNSGLYLYYLHNTFHFGYTFGTLKWSTICKYKITPNVWHLYQITWSQTHGIALYIDGTLLKSANTSTNTPAPSSISVLTIGKATELTYTSLMVTGLQLWSASREILLHSNVLTTISTPVSGGSVSTPVSGGSVSTPVSGGSVSTPVSSGSVSTPVSGGSVSTPVSGGSVSTPVSGGFVSTPVSGGSVSTPVSGGSVSTPVSGGSVSTPVSGGSVSTPVSGGSVSTPVSGGSVSTPVSGGSVSTPVSGGSVSTPVSGGSVSTPVSGGSVSTPVFGGSVSTPVSGGSVSTPVSGGSVSTPVSGGSVSTPVSGGSVSTPVSGGSVSTPVSGGSVSTPVSGGSISTPVSVTTVSTPVSVTTVSTPVSVTTVSTPVSVTKHTAGITNNGSSHITNAHITSKLSTTQGMKTSHTAHGHVVPSSIVNYSAVTSTSYPSDSSRSVSVQTSTPGTPSIQSGTSQLTTTSGKIQSTASTSLVSSNTNATLSFHTTNKQPTPVQSYNFMFTNISGNVVIAGKYSLEIHGSPTLVKPPSGENGLKLNSSKGDSATIPSRNITCLNVSSSCNNGLTVQVQVNFSSLDNSTKTYIISNGGINSTHTGLFIYYQNHHIYFGSIIGNLKWSGEVTHEIKINISQTFQLSWSLTQGLQLYIDGALVKVSNTSTTITHTPVQRGSVTIGNMHATSHSIMVVMGLQYWSASRQVLVDNNIFTAPAQPTTAPPTQSTAAPTTSAAPTTTKIPIVSFNWNLTSITTTNQILGNKFNLTVHGQAPIKDGGVEIHNATQFIDFGNHLDCLLNPGHCTHGLTIQFSISIKHIEENTHILTSGGQLPDGVGIAVIYRYSRIQFVLSTTTQSWFASCGKEHVKPDGYHTIMLSWHTTTGLEIFVDNTLVDTAKVPTAHTTSITHVTNVYFGKQPTATVSIDYFLQTITIWYVRVDILVIENICKPPVRPTAAPVTTAPTRPKATATTSGAQTTARATRVTDKATAKPATSITSKVTAILPGGSTQAPQCPVGCVSVSSTQRPAAPTTNAPATARPTHAHATATSKPHHATATKPKPEPTTTRPKATATTPSTTTEAVTPKPATTAAPGPQKPDYTTKPIIQVHVDTDSNLAFLACMFNGAIQTNVDITASLLVNGKVVLVETVKGQTGIAMFEVTKINMNLYKKQIKCSVTAHFVGSSVMTQTFISNTIVPQFQVRPGHVIVIEGHTTQSVIVTSTAPPQFYCCQGCKGDCHVHVVGSFHYDRHDHKCNNKVISQALIVSTKPPMYNKPICGFSLTVDNWNKNNKIEIKATLDLRRDGDHTRQLDIVAHVYNQPSRAQITVRPTSLTISTVQVTAKDNDHSGVATCKSVNDPHLRTFDGLNYNNMNEGEFVLYRHKTLPFEVRAYYHSCSNSPRNHATCNCAVAIKSGDDVISVIGCQGNTGGGHHPGQGHGIGLILQQLFGHHGNAHGHGHHDELARTPMTIQIYKNGALTPGTIVRRYGCGQKYEIQLPTGTIVTVQQSYKPFINVWIKASTSDRGQTEGLCGNYDGNRHNDLKPSTSHFISTWKVTGQQNFVYGVSASGHQVTTNYCSCVKGHESVCSQGVGVMYCATSRYDITATLVRQAKMPVLTRHKRQADQTPTPTALAVVEPDGTNMTLDAARDECENHIMNSTATKTCQPILTSNLTHQIDQCVYDYNATNSMEWAKDALRDIVVECVDTAAELKAANESGNANFTVTIPENLDEILTAACVEDCGTNGRCVDGVCRCNDGYSGVDCTISKDTKPIVSPVPYLCDITQTTDCSVAVVLGVNFVPSDTLICHFQYIEVGETVTMGGVMDQSPAVYISLNQVMCRLPRLQSAYIKISNNGQTQSDDHSVHVPYNSACYDCSITNTTTYTPLCMRKTDSCIVDGTCYASGAKKTGDPCQMCRPAVSDSSLSLSNAAACVGTPMKQSGEEKMERTQIIILAVVCAVFGLLIVGGIFYICRSRSASTKKTAEFGEYDLATQKLHREQLPTSSSSAASNPAYDDRM